MFWLVFGSALVAVFFVVRALYSQIDARNKRKDIVAMEAALESRLFELETQVAEAIIELRKQEENEKGNLK